MFFGGFKPVHGRALFIGIFLLLLLANVALAQKETDSNSQNLTVYAEPRPDSPVQTQLLAVTDIISHKGLDLKPPDGNYDRRQWYKVEYEHEGQAMSGYMLTTLRIGRELRIGEVSFHHVIFPAPEKPARVILYARNQGGLLSSQNLEVVASYSTLYHYRQPEGRLAEEKGGNRRWRMYRR